MAFGSGLFFGYILVYVLSYLFGHLITGVIYATLFVWLLNKSRDEKDESAKWVGIGGLGLILGLFINWIICLADGKDKTIKYAVSILAWVIIFSIYLFIFIAVIHSRTT